MAGTIGRNLHLCFTKIKRPLDSQSPSTPLSSHDHSDPLIIKSYNSLYDDTLDSSAFKSPSSSSFSSASAAAVSSSEPDFATVYASQRFFFSSPGSSNSIIESTPSIATPTESSDSLVSSAADAPLSDSSNTMNQSNCSSSLESWNSSTVKDSVAVPTYSPDPYLDFRRSMQEMVEARRLEDVKANWDYLHELLLCYLALNPKNTHKFIVRAFADLLVSLLASPPQLPAEENDSDAGGCEISRQCT
ncbi:hypothetical protein JCGZ_21913 [Jatropha curcas]|uniref:Transcription repressor n=1 Tax=Jatropha curcas TaxID=180498 RepID=A0A067JCA6_JATCU|nr:transcription repressor OFP16 [Jatropha curcas]KDP21442.1 hypothetical protein JCGZ_21913 [Jatropha curcas]